MNCAMCREELNEEEIKSPQIDEEGHVVCDACFEDKYTHLCPICEEYFDEDFTKKISPSGLLVSEYAAESVNMESGIYEITAYPFFCDGIIELELIETSINRVGDLPDEFNQDEFAQDIFYVCDGCMNIACGGD